jgi:hypothetical protein
MQLIQSMVRTEAHMQVGTSVTSGLPDANRIVG